jgi:hypothetical protein
MNGNEYDLSASCAVIPTDDDPDPDREVNDLAQQVQESMAFDDGDGIDDKDTKREEELENTDAALAFDFGDVANKYGENHRGLLAKRDILAGHVIVNENAMVYVSDIVYQHGYDEDEPRKPEEDPYFMMREQGRVDVIPVDLVGVPGGWFVALAALLIQQREDVAELAVGEGPLAFFGRHVAHKNMPPEEAYKHALRHYAQAWGADKLARWPQQEFTKLYCVMQVNASLLYLPMTHNVYAAALFTAGAFLNHSCMPNAIQFLFPGGKSVLQATKPIKTGEEIVISYKEIASDAVSRDMVHYLHQEMGLVSDHGCCCDLCGDIVTVMHAPGEEEGKVVDFDVRTMWNDKTNAAICADDQFASYVLNIVKNPDDKAAAASFFVLRTEFARYFAAKLEGRDNPAYKHDLALVLGELYCNITIHVDGQDAEDYRYWPGIYLNAVVGSNIPMFHAINTGYFARVYGMVSSMRWRLSPQNRNSDDACLATIKGQTFRMPDPEAAIQAEDMPLFIDAWVHIKMHNENVFGHVELLAWFRRVYPDVDELCEQYMTMLQRTEVFARLPPEEQQRYIQKQQELAKLNGAPPLPSESEK